MPTRKKVGKSVETVAATGNRFADKKLRLNKEEERDSLLIAAQTIAGNLHIQAGTPSYEPETERALVLRPLERPVLAFTVATLEKHWGTNDYVTRQKLPAGLIKKQEIKEYTRYLRDNALRKFEDFARDMNEEPTLRDKFRAAVLYPQRMPSAVSLWKKHGYTEVATMLGQPDLNK